MGRRAIQAFVCLSVAALPGSVRAATGDDGDIRGERPRGMHIFRPPADGLVAPLERKHQGNHTLFLNRCPGGITIYQGATDNSLANQSSIVTGQIQLNEYPFGDAAWAEIVSGVREIYAPFGITVTDIDPTPAPHDEAIVCGSDVAAGFEGAAGVAPGTCGPIDNVITYTFPETIGNDARFTIETIAQESAHGWGLDHEFKCEDPMTYLLDCGDKSFQNGDFPCGEYEARACLCGGNTQNSYQHIMTLFGPGTPDTQLPLAAITYPGDGEQFAPGDDFELAITVTDDIEVRRVFLYADGQLSTQDDASPFSGWTVTDIPAGVHELYLEAEDASGNVGVSEVITIQVGDGDGAPEPGESDGGSDDGGTSDGDDDDGDDEGGVDGGSGISGGQIPGGFGRNAEPEGCACTSAPASSSALGWSAFFGGLLLVRRRRTMTRPK